MLLHQSSGLLWCKGVYLKSFQIRTESWQVPSAPRVLCNLCVLHKSVEGIDHRKVWSLAIEVPCTPSRKAWKYSRTSSLMDQPGSPFVCSIIQGGTIHADPSQRLRLALQLLPQTIRTPLSLLMVFRDDASTPAAALGCN